MKLVLFDSNSIINRAYYGIRPLTNSEGFNCNGIYGFLNILLKFIEEEKPDLIACAFDLRAKTFRHNLYDGYKATRKGMPDDLAAQMPVLKEILTAMNIAVLEKEGYEADDIIGTASDICRQEGIACVIATGDRDDLQLINDNVTVNLSLTRGGKSEVIKYDEILFAEDYGFAPHQLVELKGLAGDSSDNIPGVKGVGEKTAKDLIQRFGSIDYIYENLETLDIKETLRTKLKEEKEMAYLSRKLGEICKTVPLDRDIKDCVLRQFDNEKLAQKLQWLNFNSILSRLDLTGIKTSAPEKPEEEIKLVNYTRLQNEKILAVIFSENITVSNGSLAANASYEQISGMLTDSNITKIIYDYKSILGMELNISDNVFDLMLGAYVINPAASYNTLDSLLEYSGEEDVRRCALMYKEYKKQLEQIKENGQEQLLFEIELPLCRVLYNMERQGFFIDRQALIDYGQQISSVIEKDVQAIYSIAGSEFNINSPKQLGEVLFNKLDLPVVKKTKTGFSTDVEVLEKLRGSHEIIEYIMEYRQLSKLQNTYVEGLLSQIEPDGKIHSSFNQTITQTGRISSTEPNLQNIPVRTELGRGLRAVFIAPEGEILLDADYSQIELRVLAHIADDKNMIDAFNTGEDIHTKTASEVFNTPPMFVTSQQRNRAKAVNFGIVYGIGAYSLSQDIKVSVKEAKSYIENYLDLYSGVREYMHTIVESGRQQGYVTTLFARKRFVPELKAQNKQTQAFGERITMNTPIQGSAADIIKIAMVRVARSLEKEGLKAKLILQVHDELIVQAPAEEKERAAQIIQYEMENAAKLSVKLEAEVKCGRTWLDAKA